MRSRKWRRAIALAAGGAVAALSCACIGINVFISTSTNDSVVGLAQASQAGADAVVGTVRPDFSDLTEDQREACWATHTPGVANGHVHGANLGVATAAYLACGGFRPLAAHEDVALVRDLEAIGARIVRRAAPVVLTSARRAARAQDGFADYLLSLEARLRAVAASPEAGAALTGVAHGA